MAVRLAVGGVEGLDAEPAEGFRFPAADAVVDPGQGGQAGGFAEDQVAQGAGRQLIAYGLITGGNLGAAGNWTLGLFVALTVLTVGTVGSTPGKRALGIRVISESGGRLGFVRVIVRTLLLALVVPALIWDRDGRGLHDRLARAVQVRI